MALRTDMEIFLPIFSYPDKVRELGTGSGPQWPHTSGNLSVIAVLGVGQCLMVNLSVGATDSPQPATDSSLNVSAQPQICALSVWGRSFGLQRAETWNKVYPYSTVTMQPVASIQLREAGGLIHKYPNLRICKFRVVHVVSRGSPRLRSCDLPTL